MSKPSNSCRRSDMVDKMKQIIQDEARIVYFIKDARNHDPMGGVRLQAISDGLHLPMTRILAIAEEHDNMIVNVAVRCGSGIGNLPRRDWLIEYDYDDTWLTSKEMISAIKVTNEDRIKRTTFLTMKQKEIAGFNVTESFGHVTTLLKHITALEEINRQQEERLKSFL